MARLNSTVHVLGDDGDYHVFGPDDDVPAEYAAKIGPHAWEDASENGAPAKSANKAEWVEYAVSQGADRGAAEAMTKDDLVAEFGS